MLEIKKTIDKEAFYWGVIALSAVSGIALCFGYLDRKNFMDYLIPALLCIGAAICFCCYALTNKRQTLGSVE